MILIVARNYERYRAYVAGFHTNIRFVFLESTRAFVGTEYTEVRLVADWWNNPAIAGMTTDTFLVNIKKCTCDSQTVNVADGLFPNPEPPETEMEFSL